MLKHFNFILISLFSLSGFTQNNTILTANNYISEEYNELLFISVKDQKMYHIKEDKILDSYVISSSSYGVGNKVGSNKTPLGLHRVKEKFGNETPLNGRMIGRVFYGQIAKIYSDTSRSKMDDVTSRILWLDGLEDELNKGEGIYSLIVEEVFVEFEKGKNSIERKFNLEIKFDEVEIISQSL